MFLSLSKSPELITSSSSLVSAVELTQLRPSSPPSPFSPFLTYQPSTLCTIPLVPTFLQLDKSLPSSPPRPYFTRQSFPSSRSMGRSQPRLLDGYAGQVLSWSEEEERGRGW